MNCRIMLLSIILVIFLKMRLFDLKKKKKRVSYCGLIWIVSLKASWRYLLILVCIAFPKFLDVFFWLMLHCNTELNWTWIHCQVGQEKGPCLWKILQGIIIPVFFLGALSALEQHHLVVIISVWTKCSSFRTSCLTNIVILLWCIIYVQTV